MNHDVHSMALLMYRLCRCSHGAYDNPHELTQSQAMALCYYYRANRVSRTISAFAAFNATTVGTASTVVDSLVRRGYVTRTRSPVDRRSMQIDLTERGREIGRGAPIRAFVDALASLTEERREALVSTVNDLLRMLRKEPERAHFGLCVNCRHLRDDDGPACGLYDIPLSEHELRQLCVKFENRRH